MVNMSSNNTKENNRVTISNNQAKYYSDVALGYANQAKIYADSAKLAESNVDLLLDNTNFTTVVENMDNINTVAENINNLGDLSTSWGNISGDISNQADLQTKLNEKVNSSDLSTVATSGSYNDLSNKPTIPDVSNLATKTELSAKANTSDLSAVATSGSYNDLSNKPTIPDVSNLATKTELSAKANTSDLSAVATSGSYNDLSDKPTIPTLPSNITTQGNTFNGANQLVKLTSDGKLPAIDGSLLTGITSSSGTSQGENLVVLESVSGDQLVEFGNKYIINPNGDINIMIDTTGLLSPFYQEIKIKLILSSVYNVGLKFSGGADIDNYFNDTAPSFTTSGTYDVTLQGYTNGSTGGINLVVGSIRTGDYDAGGLSGGDGGYGGGRGDRE